MTLCVFFQKAVDRSACPTSTGHRTHCTQPAGEQDHGARENHYRHVGTFTLLCLSNKHTLRGPFCTITCRVILQPATLVENAGRLLKNHRHPTITVTSLFIFPSPPPPPPPFCFCCMDLPSGGDSSPAMEELLKHLTEISIRQQQIVEHMAARQGETEREVAALRFTTAPRVQPPDPRVHAAQLLPKMTVHDDIEHYLSMFETIASREGWPREDWARILAPLLTGEPQQAYFSLPVSQADSYNELRKEILARVGLSPIAAAQLFRTWEYNGRLTARAQAAELTRLAQHWLLAGNPSAAQVAERVVVDRYLRALPRPLRQAVGMRNPQSVGDLVEAIELADATQQREAGERAPPFPRRVYQERRPPEGTQRTADRPAVPGTQDEPMPTEPPRAATRAWLAGCVVHQELPREAPQAQISINGRPYLALLDSGSAVSLVRSSIISPRVGDKARLPITCIHGDTRSVPTRRVTVAASPGTWPLEVGVIKDLPVPVLLGRDWPGFQELLTEVTQSASPAGNRRKSKRKSSRGPRRRTALLASDSAREGESSSQILTFFMMSSSRLGEGENCKSAARGRSAETLLETSEGGWGKRRPAATTSHPSLRRPEWPVILCRAAERGGGKTAGGAPFQNGNHYGARPFPSYGWPFGVPKHGATHQGQVSLARAGGGGQAVLPGMPRMPADVTTYPSSISADTASHYRGALWADRDGSSRAATEVCPGTWTHLGHRGLCHPIPEAIPLRKATSKAIAQELFLLCSRVGIPREILTDQGTPFMSRTMADLCRLLQVKQLRTTVYHPQTDGLVERFNKTLKQMLRRVAADDRRDWDQMLPYVLFGIREVPQASTGFTPFELLFGRQPRGLLDVAKEAWEQQPAAHRSTIEHVREMRKRIDRVMPLVREHLAAAQEAQRRHYDRAAQPREFQPGDYVLVLVPTAACKFLAKWQGPYIITEKVGPVTYRVRQPGRRKETQLYHINLLKRWVGTRTQVAALATASPVVVDINPHLAAAQKTELQHLVGQFSDVFSPLPGQTRVLQHDVRTPPGTIVRQRPYRIPEARRHAVEEGVQEMLKLGVIEPSRSPWSSPIVMVPKPDGTLRFCNDFRRLNEVSEFDGYRCRGSTSCWNGWGEPGSYPRSTSPRATGRCHCQRLPSRRPPSPTPSGHWQYRVLPFGLHGAPATFQRMMDILLRPHQTYAAAYIDDVVIHRRPGTTPGAAPEGTSRAAAGWAHRQPQEMPPRPAGSKIPRIPGGPGPGPSAGGKGGSDPLGPEAHHQEQVRAFLGLAGYYRCFIPNFSSLATALTDLTKKDSGEGEVGTPWRGSVQQGEGGSHLWASAARSWL